MTWPTIVPILVFLGLSVLDLGPMYATDRQTDVRRQTASSLNAPPRGWGHNNLCKAKQVKPYLFIALVHYTQSYGTVWYTRV